MDTFGRMRIKREAVYAELGLQGGFPVKESLRGLDEAFFALLIGAAGLLIMVFVVVMP